MQILAIEESRRYKGRFELIFDDGSRLMASKDVIAENYLHVGKELCDDDIERFKCDFLRDEARAMAVSAVNRRAMSKREVVQKLVEKGQPRESASEAADWLEEIGLIDEWEYGRLIARHYSGKGYGPRRVRDELYRRGVPRDYWDEVLSELPEQGDEILEFIESRLGGDIPDQREKKRVFDALARRGFSYSEISSAFERYVNKS